MARAKKTDKKDDPLKQIIKKRRFRILGIDTRQTFLLAQPSIEKNSKTLLTVATFVFAGSLTFLGLREQVQDTLYLKLSWTALGVSVLIHAFVHVVLLDALMAHGRVETDNERATRLLKEKALLEFSKEAFSSFANDGVFRKSTNLIINLLILQNVIVVIGGILMGVFIWQNL